MLEVCRGDKNKSGTTDGGQVTKAKAAYILIRKRKAFFTAGRIFPGLKYTRRECRSEPGNLNLFSCLEYLV